jgi:LysR family glycine cleavage system transcriptional activator
MVSRGRRLPPLNAIRAFEAAGRLLSFTKAARELNVTQAAISHQVRALEEDLGVRLFVRRHRGLALSEAGRAYLPALGAAFREIEAATGRLRRLDSAGPLTISVLPSFAAKWLVPRLSRFIDAHPDIDVRVSTAYGLANFETDGVDVALRYGHGNWPGLHVEVLLTEDVVPVCAPALLAGDRPLREPADLVHHVLLHDEWFGEPHGGWRRWLAAAGVQGIDYRRGPTYTDSNLALQAAIQGEGVALGRGALIADDVVAGRLVRLFRVEAPVQPAYYIVCPHAALRRPKVAALRDWLRREAEETPAKEEPGLPK